MTTILSPEPMALEVGSRLGHDGVAWAPTAWRRGLAWPETCWLDLHSA